MKGMVRAICIGTLLWVGPGVAPAAEKPVEELLKNMRRAYQSVKSAQLAIKIVLDNQDGVSSGVVSVDYLAPNRLRYASRVGSTEVRRYANGKRVVTQRPGSRENQDRVDVDTLGGQVAGNLEWLCLFDWKRQLSTLKGANMAKSQLNVSLEKGWRGKSWIVLDERAPDMAVRVRYFIDPKTFFIWRCDVHRMQDDKRVAQTELQKLTLNPSFAAGHFEAPRDPTANRTGGP